uniref:Expansin-like EG45 domain-containing protein n=1 Tax=Arundo donax TaxID=35708 RepID=A0A0A9AT46_ARUDO
MRHHSFIRIKIVSYCQQVRCTNPYYCSPNGVTVVITDSGANNGTDFILSQHAFAKMGQNKDAGARLLNLGYAGIEYRRCVHIINLAILLEQYT